MNQRENAWTLRRSVGMLLLLILCATLCGCALTHETHHLFDLANRTTHLEPRFFEYVKSDRVAQREARMLAEQAWGEVEATIPNASADFQNGFVEGFSDYLYRGGTGHPPVIPPRGYWHLRFLNHFGKATVNEWYEGFRQGAANCKARGIREMWIVPTSLVADADKPSKPAKTALPVLEQDLWSAETDRLDPDAIVDPDSTANLHGEQLNDPDAPPLPDSGSVNSAKTDEPESNAPADSESNEADEQARGEADEQPPFEDERNVWFQSNDEQEAPRDMREDESDPAEPVEPADLVDPGEPTDPFTDDPEPPMEEEDLFNIPSGDTAPQIPDFGVGDLQSNNSSKVGPLLIRSVGGPTPIPPQVSPNLPTQIQQTSGQLELRAADASVPTTQTKPKSSQRNKNNHLRPSEKKQEPTRLVVEPPMQQSNRQAVQTAVNAATKDASAATASGNEDIPIDKYPTLNFDNFAPVIPAKNSAIQNSKSKVDSNQGFPDDLSFDDSLPSIPLQVGAPRISVEDIQWDPMEGVTAAPAFDEVNYRGVLTSEAIEASTRWTAEMSRAEEIPLRVADARSSSASASIGQRTTSGGVNATQLEIKDHIETALAPTRQWTQRDNQLPRIISRDDFPTQTQADRLTDPVQLRIRD